MNETMIAAIIGLIGTIAGAMIGAIAALLMERSSKKSNIKQEVINRVEALSELNFVPETRNLQVLYEEKEQCIQIASGLKQVIRFCNEEAVKIYKEQGVYPTIPTAFLDRYNADRIECIQDEALHNVYFAVNMYQEIRAKYPVDQRKAILALGKVLECATIALKCTVEERQHVLKRIPEQERVVLKNRIDSTQDIISQIEGKLRLCLHEIKPNSNTADLNSGQEGSKNL